MNQYKPVILKNNSEKLELPKWGYKNMTCIHAPLTNGFYLQGNDKDNRKPKEIITSFVVYFN